MYNMSCEVIKNGASAEKGEANILYFTVKDKGLAVAGLPLLFSCNGSAILSTKSQLTDNFGRCSVVVENNHKEDVSVKAILHTCDLQDFQYGILTFR